MKKPNGKTGYPLVTLLHEVLFLFISSFLSFPLHVKRIIFCFVYSDDHKPSSTYPTLEEENLHSSCVIDVDPIPSFEIHVQHDKHIPISLEADYSGHLVENKVDLLPSTITAETSEQLVEPHFHLTDFQSRLRQMMFKPLRLPYLLHPYPSYFVEYLPHFTGKDHITAEKHLESFHNFIDNFEIMHEDVVMRLFSKSFVGDVGFWFRNLKADSIGSWEELHDVFLKYWGKNKSYDQFLFKKRE